jgi:conjugative transposon TraN protein
MTKQLFSWLSITMLAIVQALGQSVNDLKLDIAYNKTTSIVFPFSITSVDRGSKDVLVQKVIGVENVLQVKAGRKEFTETNLTVITADGRLYHFTVNYSEEPPGQTITIADSDRPEGNSLILAKDAVNAKDVNLISQQVLKEKSTGKVDRENKYRMIFTLQSIFISNDIIYYKIYLRNKSAISYDIRSLKFYVRDKKKVKRTSSQEIEAEPVYISNQKDHVDGYASAEMVFALRKFTIPDGKNLHIDMFEQNGGRNLKLKIENADILKAKPIAVNQNLLTIK